MTTKSKSTLSPSLLTSRGNFDEDGKRIMRGRPRHLVTEATQQQVIQLCAFGMTHDQVAAVMGISRPTLEKHYREQLDTGLIHMNASVAKNLYRLATGEEKEATRAAIFWLTQRGGEAWRQSQRVESNVSVQMKDAKTIDSKQLSVEDRQALREILMRATAGASEGALIEQVPDEDGE